jgi:hypothetical protein
MSHEEYSKEAEAYAYSPDTQSVITDGSLKYTGEAGGNSNVLTFQEASGAPVESNSPLGYSVGWATIVFLNLSKMVGTGIFSTRMFSLRRAPKRS